MITGFLFISKIINHDVCWPIFFKARFFRIYPLYFLAIFLVSVLVFDQSDLKLQVDVGNLMLEYIKWILFHGETINGVEESTLMLAGVIWTLKYEWLFYFSLPFIAFFIKHLGWSAGLLLVLLALFLFMWPVTLKSFDSKYFILFACGGVAAYLLNGGFLERISKLRFLSPLMGLLLIAIILYPIPLDLVHVILMACFFILVISGADFFGLLASKSAVVLGEISFSVYLLHGFCLYLLFTHFVLVDIAEVSLNQFSLLMPLICSFIVLVSAATYLVVEKSCIEVGRHWAFSRFSR